MYIMKILASTSNRLWDFHPHFSSLGEIKHEVGQRYVERELTSRRAMTHRADEKAAEYFVGRFIHRKLQFDPGRDVNRAQSFTKKTVPFDYPFYHEVNRLTLKRGAKG